MPLTSKEEIATVNLFHDNCIELTFLRENITLDVNEVRYGWQKAKELCPNKNKKVLLKTGKWTLLESDARNYVMDELKTWPAIAIVVDNLGQRIMGNFVVNMTGKGGSIKLFDNSTKAKEWLIKK